jgi:hypothetical protein
LQLVGIVAILILGKMSKQKEKIIVLDKALHEKVKSLAKKEHKASNN